MPWAGAAALGAACWVAAATPVPDLGLDPPPIGDDDLLPATMTPAPTVSETTPVSPCFFACAPPAEWNGSHCESSCRSASSGKKQLSSGEWALVVLALTGVLFFVLILSCATDALMDGRPRLPRLPAAAEGSTAVWKPEAGAAKVVPADELMPLLSRHISSLAALVSAELSEGAEPVDPIELVDVLGRCAGLQCRLLRRKGEFARVDLPQLAGRLPGSVVWLPGEAVSELQPAEPPAKLPTVGINIDVEGPEPPAPAPGREFTLASIPGAESSSQSELFPVTKTAPQQPTPPQPAPRPPPQTPPTGGGGAVALDPALGNAAASVDG
eukprot:TRINITY_DN65781_c0_g1_i1.p2 TRINITY_DN65781_c0_g1~~TRINITY_DN65781_c0_g1_i1.p2  ORF type:complete len:326 (+),score=77.00 TRINITY_DN65781_c0_g1_i1:75-1052(+)